MKLSQMCKVLPLFIILGACTQKIELVLEEKTFWEDHTVKSGETLSVLTESWQVPSPTKLLQIMKQNKGSVLRLGERIRLHKSLGPIERVQSLEFPISSRVSQLYKYSNADWAFEEFTKNFTEEVVRYSGTVDSTLWASAERAGMDIDLLLRLSEVFAWVIDFSREVQVGDEWRLVATRYLDGKEHKGWKDITVAEFKRGRELYQAFLFEDPETGRKGFFTANGDSLEKIFLKSPLKFGRVTSRFNTKRFHPVLQTRRPHLGVDYGAPTGTPIMAVGDGTVDFAARSGGGGNVIKIRHNSTYSTAYKHLSRFAKGISYGKKVRQGEIIGYVGSTGLSTGPHLHFEFLKAGSFVDPQGLKFPSASPLKTAEKENFEKIVRGQYAQVPPWPSESFVPVAIVQRAISNAVRVTSTRAITSTDN